VATLISGSFLSEMASGPNHMNQKPGIPQWSHDAENEDGEVAVQLMRHLGIQRLRTGISWFDLSLQLGVNGTVFTLCKKKGGM
jgi:hypothetical protein